MQLTCLLVCQGCHDKVAQTGWLKQKFIVSQFWGLEVQNQGAGSAVLSLTPITGNSSLLLPSFWCFADSHWHSLACRATSICLHHHMMFSCMSVPLCLFLKGNVQNKINSVVSSLLTTLLLLSIFYFQPPSNSPLLCRHQLSVLQFNSVLTLPGVSI